jgi:hypothetical protein
MTFFNQTQRRVYGEKAVEFSFLALGGLVFAQFFSTQEFSPALLVLGIILFLSGLLISYFFLKGVKGGEKHDVT